MYVYIVRGVILSGICMFSQTHVLSETLLHLFDRVSGICLIAEKKTEKSFEASNVMCDVDLWV